jgi:hypothetical protein
MNRKLLGVVLLLVGSVGGGAISGNLFFNLFTKTVPSALLTSFNKSTAHGAFVIYGFVMGIAIFAWVLVAILLAPMFAGKKDSVKP